MADKTISGIHYRVEPLGAKEAYLILSEIIRLAGPGARHLPAIVASGASERAEDQFVADVAAFAACSEVLNTHGAQAFVDLKSRVISLAQAKRPSGVYEHVDLDIDFIGELDKAEALFDFVMDVQFGNFSKGSEVNGPIALAMILIRNLFRIQKSGKSLPI